MNLHPVNEDFNSFLKKYNKHIISSLDNYYNRDNIINKKNILDLTCPICLNILDNPKSCSEKKNSHSFCKQCIDQSLKNKKICPLCKSDFEYKNNTLIEKLLFEQVFKCPFAIYGCKDIINYKNYFSHINECKFKKIFYECQVEKYNYVDKQFYRCYFKGNQNQIYNHFKSCGLTSYKCVFCNKIIFSLNFREHTLNECKIRFINKNLYKYIGEHRNNLKEGLGIIYYSSGSIYKGEFNNNMKEGYGIFINNEFIFEGDWINDNSCGYGIFKYENGDKYKGEVFNNSLEGYGEYVFEHGKYKYLGEFKKNCFEGKGEYYSKGILKYSGYWKKGKKEGLGISYSSFGENYVGEWKNGKKEGYGKYFFPNGDKYIGYFKNNYKEGLKMEKHLKEISKMIWLQV